eukprot:scaffold19987_cov137-Skeletonema_dohrnii-CCMP3373.AAC.3
MEDEICLRQHSLCDRSWRANPRLKLLTPLLLAVAGDTPFHFSQKKIEVPPGRFLSRRKKKRSQQQHAVDVDRKAAVQDNEGSFSSRTMHHDGCKYASRKYVIINKVSQMYFPRDQRKKNAGATFWPTYGIRFLSSTGSLFSW